MNQCRDGLDCLDRGLPSWMVELGWEVPLASSVQGGHGAGGCEPPPPLVRPGL